VLNIYCGITSLDSKKIKNRKKKDYHSLTDLRITEGRRYSCFIELKAPYYRSAVQNKWTDSAKTIN